MRYYFYYSGVFILEKHLWLSAEEALHCVQVLRLKEGDEIAILDGCGQKALAKIIQTKSRSQVEVFITKISHVLQVSREVHLFLAAPQSNILTKLIKQTVELGVSQITFLDTDFSVTKVNNYEKLIKQMIEAMKQCKNPYLPRLNSSIKFKEALDSTIGKVVYGAVPRDKLIKNYQEDSGSINLFIGPEGGFSTHEKEMLNNKGEALTVGSNILRIETAVVGLLAKLI